MSENTTVLFVSHGGGPMPLLGEPGHQEMANCVTNLGKSLPKPERVLIVSAHWEESRATLLTGEQHPLLFDYYGFPKESYEFNYPCNGLPEWSKELRLALEQANIPAQADPTRGYDHGMFVPMMLMYPEADIPCTQLSLLKSLDAEQHIHLGQALREHLPPNTLVLGSGFTFHNLNVIRMPQAPEIQNANLEFESWLTETMASSKLSEEERTQRLVNWETAPYARMCHPREEHLLPLHVCYGVAERPTTKHYELTIFGKRASMYLWT